MADYNLTAKKREISTKGAVNQMRKNGEIPGIFYAKGEKAVAISVKENSFKPLVFTAETHLVNLTIEADAPVRCMVKDVQFHPVTDRIIHFDLQGVNANEAMVIEVPILFTGSSAGVKEGGVLQENLHKLEIECMPSFVPEHLEVDLSELHLGKSIHVGDLHYDNIKILNAPDVIVVTVISPRGEEELETGSEAVEPEVIGKGKADNED